MDKNKILSRIFYIIGLAAASVIIGYMLFIATIILLFMGIQYLAYGILAIGVGIIIYIWAITFGKGKRKIINFIVLGYLLIVFLIAGSYGLVKAIDDNVPIVGDGSLLLGEYIPFEEDSRLVQLNETSTLKLTDNLPRVDGATALFPVYSAFIQAVYPKTDYSKYKESPYWLEFCDDEINEKLEGTDFEDIKYLKCTKTNKAYERLINGDADIIFAAGPSDNQLKMAETAGVKMKLTPIGKEAFVFFVNSKNNVSNLTISQIQKIYSGEITNWSEIGGENEKIRAFQRPENSGSQTSLERLMNGKTLMKPIEEDVVGGMGGIIAKTANYKNYKNAIGYSFRYFSTEMVKDNEIKHVALNGVMPTKETIRDGSYPISNNFYAITLENNNNPNITKFIDWILSEQGQNIVEETGYVGV